MLACRIRLCRSCPLFNLNICTKYVILQALFYLKQPFDEPLFRPVCVFYMLYSSNAALYKHSHCFYKAS